MTITKSDIRRMREQSHMAISAAKEQEILRLFGSEPDDEHQWSEQDIHEQIRKILSA